MLDPQTAGWASRRTRIGQVDFARNRALVVKENDLKPWQKQEWCTPEVSDDFVAAMEDVLELYNASYDPRRAVTCFEETPRQLIDEARAPQPMMRGHPAREDTE